MPKTAFRHADSADCGLILSFIRKLAVYEHMEDQVVATEELLNEWIFEKKRAEVLFICEDGKEVGFALYFHNFSTFLGRAGIDFYLSLGAQPMDDWTVYRITGETLRELGGSVK